MSISVLQIRDLVISKVNAAVFVAVDQWESDDPTASMEIDFDSIGQELWDETTMSVSLEDFDGMPVTEVASTMRAAMFDQVEYVFDQYRDNFDLTGIDSLSEALAYLATVPAVNVRGTDAGIWSPVVTDELGRVTEYRDADDTIVNIANAVLWERVHEIMWSVQEEVSNHLSQVEEG